MARRGRRLRRRNAQRPSSASKTISSKLIREILASESWDGVPPTEVMFAGAPKDDDHAHGAPGGGMGGMAGMDM
jgi:hypothetical protein